MQPFQLPDRSQTDQHGKALRYNCCKRRTCDSPVKYHDKQQIQRHIHDRRRDHGVQRRPAVSQSAQHRGKQVISQDHRDAGKRYPEIELRTPDNIRRRVQNPQKQPQSSLSDNQQHRAESNGEYDCVPHSLFHGIFISCAVELGKQNGKSLRDACHHPQEHPVQPVGGPQGRQRLHAHALPDHHRIYHNVELLKYISDHQWYREQKNQSARRTLCHIFDSCHLNFLPCTEAVRPEKSPGVHRAPEPLFCSKDSVRYSSSSSSSK